jgi:hypothetical protein
VKIDTGIGRCPAASRGALTAGDCQLLVAVAIMQVMTAVAVRAMPLPLLRARATRLRRFAQFLAHGDDERVVWAIQASGRRLGPVSNCLVRAVVAELTLGSAERPLCFTIGVKRAVDGVLMAHAWVASKERILIGAASDDYVPLVEWNGVSG